MVDQKKKPTVNAKEAAAKEPIAAAISKLDKPQKPAKSATRSAAMSNKKTEKSVAAVTNKSSKELTPKPGQKITTKEKTVKKPVGVAVKATKTDSSLKTEKTAKKKPATVKPPKLVRDSFTFPKADYERIGALKSRLLKTGVAVKKSELVRAGLVTLSNMSDTAILNVISELEILKPGRPSK